MWFDAGVMVATSRRAAVGAFLAAAVAVLGALLVPLGASATGSGAASEAVDGGRFAGTARLPGCSGAVVRWPASLDSDRAVVLTNGHCVRRPFLGAREVLVDEKRWTRVELLDGLGDVALAARAVRLEYATMFRTDVAVLRLRQTYADLAGAGVAPLSLAAEGPSRGDRVRIPSGYWAEQRGCATTGTAHRVHERKWDWWDSIRLPARDGCAIRGGYSGSPIVSRETGLVVGVANTGYVGGRRCIDSACEENRRGRVVMRKHMNYGQQTSWLLGCLDAGRVLDLDLPGCRLPARRG